MQLPYWHHSCSHNESLQFVTELRTNENHVINIQELQPTSNPPCLTAKSFPVPSADGKLSFSPVSLHASYVTTAEVVVLDIQSSKILFHTKATEPFYRPPGQFSPDGSFLACSTLDRKICIWRNTPTGYAPWSTLQPRLLFDKFSFSPTTVSVLTWGPKGIQLLHPESSVSSPSPNKTGPRYPPRDYLVACSINGAHIVIAQQGGRVVTVLDPHLGTTIHSIHVHVRIEAIGMVDGTILVAGGDRLLCWNLRAGKRPTARGSYGIIAVSPYINGAYKLVISNDHSLFAFVVGGMVILYNITARAILTRAVVDNVLDIQFSQDGHQLYVHNINSLRFYGSPTFSLRKFEVVGYRCSVSVMNAHPEGMESCGRFLPPTCGYYAIKTKWIMDSNNCKSLWLPPNWRTKEESDVRLEGNFLALVGRHHQKPIIIELQPQPYLRLSLLSSPLSSLSVNSQFPSESSSE